MEILWLFGAFLCFRLIKWSVGKYRVYIKCVDELREERITELVGPPVMSKTEKQNNTAMESKKQDSTQLMIETLKEIGCHPDLGKDGTISVAFQGEKFVMQPNGLYVRIWDPSWSGMRVDDPYLPMLREAVNEANYSLGPTVLLGEPDDEIIRIHSRLDIILFQEIPDIAAYVGAMLDSFFHAKENVREKFMGLYAEQEDAQKKIRPVGFDLSETNFSGE